MSPTTYDHPNEKGCGFNLERKYKTSKDFSFVSFDDWGVNYITYQSGWFMVVVNHNHQPQLRYFSCFFVNPCGGGGGGG